MNKSNSILIEPTWGAGVVENSNFVKSDHDMSWFDVDPCWMIFTHYPKNPNDQLLGEYVLSSNEYKLLPYLHPSYVEYGFDGADLLSYFIHTSSYDFPKIYPHFGDYIEFVDIPIASKLQQNEEYSIFLIKKKECHLAIINGKNFLCDDDKDSIWRKERHLWKITFSPKKRGTITLSMRDDENTGLYRSILEYTI